MDVFQHVSCSKKGSLSHWLTNITSVSCCCLVLSCHIYKSYNPPTPTPHVYIYNCYSFNMCEDNKQRVKRIEADVGRQICKRLPNGG